MARWVRLHSPSHPDLLLHRASELRHARALCDVLVRVGQRDFPAHSLVLACASRTLARLLLPQGPSKLCSLDFLVPATFKRALDFAYTGSLEVASEELTSLLRTARDLEMDELEQACLRAMGTGGPDGTGIDDRVGGHDRAAICDRTGGHDGVGVGDRTGSHDGAGDRTGGHDEVATGDRTGDLKGVAIGDRAGGPDKVGTGDRIGGRDGVGIGDWADSHDRVITGDGAGGHDAVVIGNRAGSHDRVSTQDVRKETVDGMSQMKSVGASPVGKMVAPGNHDLVLLDDGPCLALARPDSKGSQIQDGSLAPSWVLFEQSSLKPRESVITATAQTLPQEHHAHPWPPEALWGSEGVVAGYQPCPPLLSYQLRSLPSPLGDLGPGHMALSASVGFHGYIRPIPCGLEMGKPSACIGIADREKQREDQRQLADPAKSSAYDLCPQRGPDSLRLPLLCHPRPQTFPLPPCRAQRSCDKDLLPLSMAPPGEPAAAASPTLYLMYGPQCPPWALPAGAWSYVCQLCQQRFPSQTALRRHSRSHMGQRLLDREFCARRVQAVNGLRGPRRAPPGEKPYECGECSKRFTLKHQMETHYRVHTGEKPFQCKLCPQRSRDYSAMIKHLRTHGGAAPYRCTLCCQFCPSLAAMQKHMKSHCPEELPSDWTIETTYLYTSSTSS